MNDAEKIHPAKWWKAAADDTVECFLCPRRCIIHNNKSGFCGVRTNLNGKLYSLSYGYPVALQIDPIEKKPLAEFLPGSKTFSLGTFGCNLNCCFCQNSSLARGNYQQLKSADFYSPEVIVELALKYRCESVAFTYNEPTVFAEYAIDIAELAHKKNLKTVLVTNGYIESEARADLYPLIDAANIDMKGFSESFYHDMTGSQLQPVLDSIKYLYSLGHHLEITNLVIPVYNDAPEIIDQWLDWVEQHLDKSVPLHFSAFHPSYRLTDVPRTPSSTLYGIKDRAVERGFTSIHLGNI